jgi:hypothetical protein
MDPDAIVIANRITGAFVATTIGFADKERPRAPERLITPH